MNFVISVDEPTAQRIISFYRDFKTPNPSEHVRFFAKTEQVAITLYKSGKVMFQGEDAKGEYDFWTALLKHQPAPKQIKQTTETDYYYPSIGSDETGKGDLFGPIVICSAYLPKEHVERVMELGIQDSKTLTDKRVHELAEVLIPIIPHSVLTLPNDKYNDLVDKGYNINKMLAYMHNRAIFNVIRKINKHPEVILDKFAEEHLYFRYLSDADRIYRKITILTKAESKYASVAIASIIARHVFIQKLDALSKAIGYNLHKGAGAPVDQVLKVIMKEQDQSFLRQIAKLNFNNIKKMKSQETLPIR